MNPTRKRPTRKRKAATEPTELGRRLRAERLRRHASQADAAHYFAIHQTSYHRWETGETAPPSIQYGHVADYIGVTVDQVWTMVGGGAPPTTLESLRDDFAALQRQVDQLREELHRKR